MKQTHKELTDDVDSKLIEWDNAYNDRFLKIEHSIEDMPKMFE